MSAGWWRASAATSSRDDETLSARFGVRYGDGEIGRFTLMGAIVASACSLFDGSACDDEPEPPACDAIRKTATSVSPETPRDLALFDLTTIYLPYG